MLLGVALGVCGDQEELKLELLTKTTDVTAIQRWLFHGVTVVVEGCDTHTGPAALRDSWGRRGCGEAYEEKRSKKHDASCGVMWKYKKLFDKDADIRFVIV